MKTVFKISGVILIILTSFIIKVVNEETSDILLFNIEALANGEGGTDCIAVGSVDCPISSSKVYMVY